jgi:hypothetical protein
MRVPRSIGNGNVAGYSNSTPVPDGKIFDATPKVPSVPGRTSHFLELLVQEGSPVEQREKSWSRSDL